MLQPVTNGDCCHVPAHSAEGQLGRVVAGQPAIARRRDRDVRVGGRYLELIGDHSGQLCLAQADQAFVIAVQTPQVAWVLTGARQGGVQAKVSPVHRLSFGYRPCSSSKAP